MTNSTSANNQISEVTCSSMELSGADARLATDDALLALTVAGQTSTSAVSLEIVGAPKITTIAPQTGSEGDSLQIAACRSPRWSESSVMLDTRIACAGSVASACSVAFR